MIALTARNVLRHTASWHEKTDVNEAQAVLVAADIQATKEKLYRDVIRQKLGNVPSVEALKDRFEVQHYGDKVDGDKLYWVVLDGEAIAIFTEVRTRTENYRYIAEWKFKSLVA